MQYRSDKYDNSLSVLGYGCMRFTQHAGRIDIDKAEREIVAAVEAGINYFDTAYIYPGSESALGEILERNGLRDSVCIASKLPHYMIKKTADTDRFLDEQLRRLRTDHIDYYLLHAMGDPQSWQRLCELGVKDRLESRRADGSIRQIGFSFHGNSDMFCRLLDAYDWDFCQIQYNYIDENSQAGRVGLLKAAEKGIPVIIMEPLRGGKLSTLPADAEKLLDNYPLRRSPTEWALRWLWDQPQVTCVLSGMNSLEMVQENCAAASDCRAGEFSDNERELLRQVVAVINAKMKVGCTACRYCMPCPQGVDIPTVFSAYNRIYSEGYFGGLKEYIMCTAMRRESAVLTKCIGCGKCEQHCPQNIEIRRELKNASVRLETPLMKLVRRLLALLMRY